MGNQQVVILFVGLAVMLGLMFWPQWQARRRRQKQMSLLQVGSEVMTIGGILGKLTYINAAEDRARIEVAPGVEIQVIVGAINPAAVRPVQTEEPAESEESPSEDDTWGTST